MGERSPEQAQEQVYVSLPDNLSDHERAIRFQLDQALTSGDEELLQRLEAQLIIEDMERQFSS